MAQMCSREQDALAAPLAVLAAQDADVDLVGEQHRVDVLAADRRDLGGDGWVARVVVGQFVGQPVHRVVDGDAGAQRAGDAAALQAELLLHGVELLQDVRYVREDNLAGRCELDALARAQHEREAELLLHLPDPLGDRRLRDIEFVRGMRDVARAPEHLQEVEILFIQWYHPFGFLIQDFQGGNRCKTFSFVMV